MKNLLKRELINDVVTGLMVAATFTAVIPADAFAQLATVAGDAQSQVMAPFVKFTSYISYGLGTVFTVKGISDIKKHTENPASNPLGKGLGALGAGGAFLTAPTVAGMLVSTSSSTGVSGSAGFSTIGGM